MDQTWSVLITEPGVYTAEVLNALPEEWECHFADITDSKELLRIASHNRFEIIFAKLGLDFNDDFFKAAKGLKILATPTTGLNHIDLQSARETGVEVVSLKGEVEFLGSITSTAEHAWTLLLCCARNITESRERCMRKSWSRQNLQIHQLSGKTLGIIGYGRLGRIISDYGKAFRMNVIANDPFIEHGDFKHFVRSVELDRLLAESEYIILSASYRHGQKPILGERELLCAKKKPVLVNISRGELVDEDALLNAYDANGISAMGLDVLHNDSTWNEDMLPYSRILERSALDSHILVTPHVGGYALEAVASTRAFLIKQVCGMINRLEIEP